MKGGGKWLGYGDGWELVVEIEDGFEEDWFVV